MRVYNPNHVGYPRYGGRGITVCQRWLDSFLNFLEDMGERPPEHQLDRIDTDGHYEPSNCRWVTRSEQMLNRKPYTCPNNRGLRDIFLLPGTIRKRYQRWRFQAALPGGHICTSFDTREEAEEFQLELAYEREFHRALGL